MLARLAPRTRANKEQEGNAGTQRAPIRYGNPAPWGRSHRWSRDASVPWPFVGYCCRRLVYSDCRDALSGNNICHGRYFVNDSSSAWRPTNVRRYLPAIPCRASPLHSRLEPLSSHIRSKLCNPPSKRSRHAANRLTVGQFLPISP